MDNTDPAHIHLYNDGAAETLVFSELATYLQGKFPNTAVDIRGDFYAHFDKIHDEKSVEQQAHQIAGIRVRNLNQANSFSEPLYGEIDFEKKGIKKPQARPFGILYDGFELSLLFQKPISPVEFSEKHLHIVFTNRLFGTFDPDDHRYHARVSINSYPCIISTTGIIEAPAKPKEFYILKQRLSYLGSSDVVMIELKERFRGRFIDHEDERLTEVMKGYIMQSWFYHVTGEAFCPNKNCRLFNAHWQEELIHAQLKTGPEFCPHHEAELTKRNILKIQQLK